MSNLSPWSEDPKDKMLKALRITCENWESFLDYWEMAVRRVDALCPIPSLSDLSLGYPAVFLLVDLALGNAVRLRWQWHLWVLCCVSLSLQPADQVQKCILMPSHALHLDRWQEGKINLLKQNTFVHFASRRGIEVSICNGGGKAYCWISAKNIFHFHFPRL